jgi:hypothetical protein
MVDEPNPKEPARVIVLVVIVLALAWAEWVALS